LFAFSLFISVRHAVLAQQDQMPLRAILQSLEQRFTISFTYLDETVDGIYAQPPAVTLNLSESLRFLSANTKLLFTQLDERSFTISKPGTTITVCGVLVDKETKEKIIGATIQCKDLFTISDAEGRFQLKDVEGEDIILIRSLGYFAKSIQANQLASLPCSSLELSMLPRLLSEVIIANYPTTGISKLLEGSYSIQTDALGILPGLTEPDVLFTAQSLPGIQSIDETVSNINVRGGTSDQNLILWDGMKMYQQGHFFGLISAFNPYFTKHVDLIKNGTSTMFSDGVSSTIDIRSDDAVNPVLTGGVGLNMINADAHLKVPISKKSSLHLAFRRSLADILKTPTYREYYDRAFRGTDVATQANDTISTGEKFVFYDVSAKYLLDFSSKDKLRVSLFQARNNIEYTETEISNNRVESRVSSLDQQNGAIGVSYSRLWSTTVRTTGHWYVSRYSLSAVNNDIPNQQELKQENDVLDMGIKLDARMRMSERVELFTGYQFFEVGVTNLEDINNPPFYRNKKEVLRTHVIFAESNYTSPSTKTSIRAGLRGNWFTKFNIIRIEPRIVVSHKLNSHFSVELLAEMKSQTTTQVIDFQNDFLGVEKRKWVLANDNDIPIIKSKQLSIGANYQRDAFLISLEAYGKWVDDIITSSQGFQNQFQFVRTQGRYKNKRVVFVVNRKISKINSWISYSFARSDYTFDALTPSTFPNNFDIRHRATWGISYMSTHLDISLGINWRNGKPYTEPTSPPSVINGEIQYQSPNSFRLPNYWRLDFSAKYKFVLSGKVNAVAGISVWNAWNHENTIDIYYQLNEGGVIIPAQRIALAFTPNLMFRVEF
jgi:hypothetical protein